MGIYRALRSWIQGREGQERILELLGAHLALTAKQIRDVSSLHEAEFKVYSQWGDDGIIQWLITVLPDIPETFIEFGVEDYSEANTRFLLVNNNWSGLVIDASSWHVKRIRRRRWFWRYDLTATCKFLTRENIDKTLHSWAGDNQVGLMHIDVDGNDYWFWESIHSIVPDIVIVEYNSLFGSNRLITIPYDSNFNRYRAHYTGLYAGASLGALDMLARKKGYALIGTNSAGNNAYFIKKHLLSDAVQTVSVNDAFIASRFRDSRDQLGRLDYRSYEERQEIIRGLPVLNLNSGKIEPF